MKVQDLKKWILDPSDELKNFKSNEPKKSYFEYFHTDCGLSTSSFNGKVDSFFNQTIKYYYIKNLKESFAHIINLVND